MKTRSRKPQHGFTLIELLVAMAITTVIITVLVSVTSMALDTCNRSRSEIRAARQGKAMIDTMASDLESFVVRKGNNFEWLYAGARDPSDPDFPKDAKGNASPNAIDFIFFSAATDRYDGKIGTADDGGGDVSTVGYQLAYKDPISGSLTNDGYKTFVLYRKIVNPDKTFESLLGEPDLRQAFTDYVDTDTAIDAEENFICENVYQFTVSFHVDVTTTVSGNTTVKSVSVPIGNGTGGTMSDEFKMTGAGVQTTFDPTGVSNAELMAGRLTSVEISMSVITDFGLKQLKSRTFANDTAKAEFIAENTYQYSKLVQVPGS